MARRKKNRNKEVTPERLTKYFFKAYPWWTSLILCCVIGVIIDIISLFVNGPVFLGFVFSIPALIGMLLTYPLSRLFSKNLFRWKYAGMLALVTEGVAALFLVLLVFTNLQFAFVLGVGFMLFIRHFVLCGVVHHHPVKMMLPALSQPLFMVIGGVYIFGISELITGLISLVVFGGLGILYIWLFDLPLKKALGINGMEFANVYFKQILYDHNDMEQYLQKIAELGIVPETTFFFRREGKKDIWFVVPNLHPGPLADIGGSNFPKILHDELQNEAEVVVSHGSASHDMNLISNAETKKIRDTILQSRKGLTYSSGASVPFRMQYGTVSLLSQRFGNSLLMVTTRSPSMTEDIDYPLGRIIMGEARHLYENFGLVDAHNCMPTNTHIIYPGTDEGTEFILGARKAMEKMKNAPLLPFKSGVVNKELPFTRSEGFGEMGLSVFVTVVNDFKTVYVVFDGNNVEAGVREVLRDEVLKLVDEAEILTTDTHVVNSLTSRNPIGMVIPAVEILPFVLDAVNEALDDCAPSESAAATCVCRGVKVFGPGKFTKIASYVTGVVMNMVPYMLLMLVVGILIVHIECQLMMK